MAPVYRDWIFFEKSFSPHIFKTYEPPMTNALSAPAPTVQADSFLTLHYRLSGPVGDVINTFSSKPATLTLGTGALSEALEQRLLGLKEGTRSSFELPAGEAFGARNPDMLQWLSRKELAQLGDPLEQYQVGDVMQFATPDGKGLFGGVVRQLRADERGEAVLFDFNHPLAGEAVTFEVQLLGVL
jgi:FKBP-type peptidyl-prolyl cis-trans isomerase SlpA